MRYIGSKSNMLPHLEDVFAAHTQPGGVLLDVFGGTGAVGRNFKNRFITYGNDLLYFAYLMLFAQIELNSIPSFKALQIELKTHPIEYLNNLANASRTPARDPLVYREFSPGGELQRMYFREGTALHIDLIRQTIDDWAQAGLISDAEAKYLLACLVIAVPSVSNIAGTYGAFLKSWDKRTEKPLRLETIPVIDNQRANRALNSDALDVVSAMSGDVLYIDPPYNARQYNSNYHVLETIARYDYPVLFGKTGLRREPERSSDFCRSNRVAQAFHDLLSKADFGCTIVSYSNEGLLPEQDLISIAEGSQRDARLFVYRFPYRRYSRLKSSDSTNSQLEELVVVIER